MSALVSLGHQLLFFCCCFLFKFDEDGFKHLASTINHSYIIKKSHLPHNKGHIF